MRISTRGRYALISVLYMAQTAMQEPVAIRQIAKAVDISEKYLEQLFFVLRKKGILETVRGPKGGYFIAKKFDELYAGEIVRAVEGELAPVPCLKSGGICDFNLNDCITKNLWKRISNTIDTVLDTVTISSLLQSYEKLADEKDESSEYFI